ncbi:MAG: IS1634 family transposase [Candidatus Competibacteraceae bacterium]
MPLQQWLQPSAQAVDYSSSSVKKTAIIYLELRNSGVLITNVPELPAADVVAQYKSLADIERGFRVLKSDLELAPVYHRLPERIRAHTAICFLALVLQRVLRQRLHQRQWPNSPQMALAQLRTVQRHRVRLPNGQTLTGISHLTDAQHTLLEALQIEIPTEARLTAAM